MPKMPILLKFYPKKQIHRLSPPGGQPLSTDHHPSRPRLHPGGHRSSHRKIHPLFPSKHHHHFHPHRSLQLRRSSTRLRQPGEQRPPHHLLTTSIFYAFILACHCCHRAQALEYQIHHLRRRRAPARPASTPSLLKLPRRTSRTTPTTRTLDSTPPGRLLTTRASPHRTFGLTSHRADSKFLLHLHSSSPSFYAFILHLLSSPPPTLSASSPAHRIIPPPTLGRCIPTGAAPHLTPHLTSHFTSHRIMTLHIA